MVRSCGVGYLRYFSARTEIEPARRAPRGAGHVHAAKPKSPCCKKSVWSLEVVQTT